MFDLKDFLLAEQWQLGLKKFSNLNYKKDLIRYLEETKGQLSYFESKKVHILKSFF